MKLHVSIHVLALMLAVNEAHANPRRFSVGVASELNLLPAFSPSGLLIADLRLPVAREGALRVAFNTETLQVGLESIALTERLRWSVFARGQVAAGGLLGNFALGELLANVGFWASYVQIGTSFDVLLGSNHTLTIGVSGRRWIFNASVDPAVFSLPPDAYAVEPRLRYTYWNLRHPEGDFDATILHPRFLGFAFGVELAMDYRSATGTFGLRTPSTLRPFQLNQRPLMARQWLRVGVRPHPRLRLQLEQSSSYGVDEDDFTRVRVGGMNPYAVQVPGLPWTVLLSERHFAAHLGVHWRVSPRHEHELGVAVGGGAFNGRCS